MIGAHTLRRTTNDVPRAHAQTNHKWRACRVQEISRVQATNVARLWAGMGSVVELAVHGGQTGVVNIIAKRVTWQDASPCSLSIGDRRKRGLQFLRGREGGRVE